VASPLLWALLHAAFVLAMSAAQIAYWHFAASAQAESDRQREDAASAAEDALRTAARGGQPAGSGGGPGGRRRGRPQHRAGPGTRAVLARVAGTGERLGSEAGEALLTFERRWVTPAAPSTAAPSRSGRRWTPRTRPSTRSATSARPSPTSRRSPG
jgi:hypothetical protein